MVNKIDYCITDEVNNKKVKDILKKQLHLSTRHIRRIKDIPGGLLLNGEDTRLDQKVQTGDILTYDISDDNIDSGILPIEGDIDIAYEDEYILVINKPANMLVHPTSGHKGEVTVANIVIYYLNNKGVECAFHAVNRLDYGTSGLMVVAKSAYMHNIFCNMLHTNEFTRSYLAVVDGIVEKDAGVIDAPIKRAPSSIIERMVSDKGAAAITNYEVLEREKSHTLVRLMPQTGRTHQLRVHMAWIGHPLTGDFLYGIENKELIDRHALHSEYISFIHPITKERIEIRRDMPEDMKRALLD